MKKRTRILKNEEGFTLIEIIAVLVIMGILAAVAVPKFFDLQSRAREKAIYTAVSEIKVRVNQHFANQLLNGKAVALITYADASVGLDIGKDFKITTLNWSSGATNLQFNIDYFPGGDNTNASDPNLVTTPVYIQLPQTS